MKKISGAVIMLLVLQTDILNAASKNVGFFDLNNTNTVVLISFLLFITLLVYLKVPQIIGVALDSKVDGVNDQIQKAISVKDDSVELLAAMKRQETKATENAVKIVADARSTSKHDLDQIEIQLSALVSRKLKAAEDQIKMAEHSAVNEISHKSTEIAIKVTQEYLIKNFQKSHHTQLINSSIKSLGEDIKSL